MNVVHPGGVHHHAAGIGGALNEGPTTTTRHHHSSRAAMHVEPSLEFSMDSNPEYDEDGFRLYEKQPHPRVADPTMFSSSTNKAKGTPSKPKLPIATPRTTKKASVIRASTGSSSGAPGGGGAASVSTKISATTRAETAPRASGRTPRPKTRSTSRSRPVASAMVVDTTTTTAVAATAKATTTEADNNAAIPSHSKRSSTEASRKKRPASHPRAVSTRRKSTMEDVSSKSAPEALEVQQKRQRNRSRSSSKDRAKKGNASSGMSKSEQHHSSRKRMSGSDKAATAVANSKLTPHSRSPSSSRAVKSRTRRSKEAQQMNASMPAVSLNASTSATTTSGTVDSGSGSRTRLRGSSKTRAHSTGRRKQQQQPDPSESESPKLKKQLKRPSEPGLPQKSFPKNTSRSLMQLNLPPTYQTREPPFPSQPVVQQAPEPPPTPSTSSSRARQAAKRPLSAPANRSKLKFNPNASMPAFSNLHSDTIDNKNDDSDDGMNDNSARRPRTRRASTSQLLVSRNTTTTTATNPTTIQTTTQLTAQSHPKLKPTPVVRKPLKALANKARQAWQESSMHSRASFATHNTNNNNTSMETSSHRLDDYQHSNLSTTGGHLGDEAERDDDDPDYIRTTVAEKAAQVMATKKEFATEKAKWWKMKKRLSFTSGPLGGGKGEKKVQGMGGSSDNNNLMDNSSSNNNISAYQPPTVDAAHLIVDHRRRPPPSVSDTSTNADDSMRASVTPSMQSLDQSSQHFLDSLGHLSSSDDSDVSDDDYESNDDDTSLPSEDVESMRISAASLPNMMDHSSSELMEQSASSMPNMNRSFGDSRIQPSNSLLGGDSGEDEDDDGIIPQKRSKSTPLLPKKKKSKASKIKSKITKGMKKKKKSQAKHNKYQDTINEINDEKVDTATANTNHKKPSTVEVDMEKQDSVSIYNDSFRSSNLKEQHMSLSLGESNHTSKPSLAVSSLAKSTKTAPTMPHGGVDPLALRHDSPNEPSPQRRVTNSVQVLADFLDQYDDMDALFSLGLEDAAAAQQQESFDRDAMTIGQQSQLTEVSNGSPVDAGDASEITGALSKASKTSGKKAKRKSRASIVLKRFIKNFDDVDDIVQEDEGNNIGSIFTDEIDEEGEQPKRNSKIKVKNTPAAYKAKAMAGGDIFDVLETPDTEENDDDRGVESDTPKKKKKSRASFVFKKFMKNFDELDILFSKGKGNEESNHQSFGHKSDTMAAHNASGMFSMGSASSYSRKSLPAVLDKNNGAVDPRFEEDKSLDEVSMPDNPSPPQSKPHPLPESNILKEMLEMSEEDLKTLFAKEKATEMASQDIHDDKAANANNVISSAGGSSPDNDHSNGSSEDDILSKISEEPSTVLNRRSLTSVDLTASLMPVKETSSQRDGRLLRAESLTMEALISPELEDDTDDEGDDSNRKKFSQSTSCINERGPTRSTFEVRNNIRKKSPLRRRIERSSSPSPRFRPRVKRVLSEASGMSLAELESQNDGSKSGRLGRRNYPFGFNESASNPQSSRSFSVSRGDRNSISATVDKSGVELTSSQAKLNASFNGFSNFQRSFSPRARPRQKIISENAAASPSTPRSGRRLPVRQVRSGRGDSMFRSSLPNRIDLLVDSPSETTKRRMSQPDDVRKSLLERRKDFEGLLNSGLEDAAAPVTTNQLEVDQEAIEDMKAVKARTKKEQDNLIQQFNRRAIQRSTSKKRSTSADNPRESAAARRARNKSPMSIRRVGSQGMMSSDKQSPASALLSAKKRKASGTENVLASANTGSKPLSEFISGENEISVATTEAPHGIVINRYNSQSVMLDEEKEQHAEAHDGQERISFEYNTSDYSDDATSEASSPYIIDPTTTVITGFSSQYRLSSSIGEHELTWEDFSDKARQRAMQSVPWRNRRGLAYHIRQTQEAKTQKIATLQLDDTFHWRHFYDMAKTGRTKSLVEFSRGKPVYHRNAEGVLYSEEKEQDTEPCHRGRAVQGNFDAGYSVQKFFAATDDEDDDSIVYPTYKHQPDGQMDRRASGDSISSFA